ncbi:unnamed protein product [Lactuca saligna]|uniref:Replication factor A C-terminal domain-containing protein n=1 Tax=Lactuca saligna TaxID=75948 RepID=A0AA35YBA9_LACSI|nr:unnamed protein product [Lactuca saligna]
MILMDEEGSKIHASCVKKWFSKFQSYLKEDSSIYVKKPNVAPNTSKFKFVHPESKLTFNHNTTVKDCDNFSGSAHGFDFVDFNTIISNNILEAKSFDIIGHIFEYGRMDTSKQDKSQHKMLLHLQDIEDTKLKVTIWGQNAYYMSDFLANNNSLAPVVVIVQFTRMKFINGRPFSSTYFDVSRLVSENNQQLSSCGIKMIASKQDREHDDFLKNHLFSNIDDVIEPLEEKMVIIVGTVKGIRQNIRWYYLACSNCKKSAREKSTSTDKVDGSHEVAEIVTYECTNPICKNIKFSVIPRFKISLRVQDNTGTLTLTLFDQEAKKLFKYTAKELYDKNKKPANSDSFIIGTSDITSQDTKVLKTGENLTPSAIDKSTATSHIKLISTPNELKRNLATSIDLDEMENFSTSKSARLSPPDEQPTPLLVPKKEK